MDRTGNGVFEIDGLNLRLQVKELKRSFAVTDTENSGRTQSYEMHRDIAGTFYNYTISIDVRATERIMILFMISYLLQQSPIP